jgi:hypothetical protein
MLPMLRVSAVALLVFAAILSASCADNILKERPVARTSRTSAVKPTFSAAGSAKGESSVCAAYRRQLRVVQLRQLTQSGKAHADELKAKELSLNAIIADACE